MTALNRRRKAELCELFQMDQPTLYERRAEHLARKNTLEHGLARMADAVVVARKKELNSIAITLRAIELAEAYRESDRFKELCGRLYQLQGVILGPDLFHEGEDEGELVRAAEEARAEYTAVMDAEREEVWQILLANL
jgi:hypothetical protein